MSLAATAGWALALALALALAGARRRLAGIASAEHELRGALCGISLGIASIERGVATAGIAGDLQGQLDRAIAVLGHLQGGLSRSGTPAPCGELCLERYVSEAAGPWRSAAAAAGRSLEVDWQAGSVRLRADRGRLAQVLGNLISNALEHGRGGVRVRGRRTAQSVIVQVGDAGAGPSRVPQGRTRALAVAKSRRRADAGSRGRGLDIAAEAAKDVGGRLTLVPSGEGHEVALELPLDDG